MSVHASNEASYDDKGRWRTRTYAKAEVVGSVDQVLYIKGDEFTNDSIRDRFPEPNGAPVREWRDNGVWVTAYIVDELNGEFVFEDAGDRVTV